ncbi:hypothetical protein M3654_24410, partial [Bacillus licheniformis]|nr:hypothetical protein [Bacillus licheniformis]
HSGASKAARTQRILGIASLTPLLIVGIVPFVTGDVPMSNLLPLLPLGHDAQGNLTAATFGSWNGQGVTMALGAMTALRQAGKQRGVTVVSIDGTKDFVTAIANGSAAASVETNPRFGPLAFKSLEAWFAGKPVAQK